MRIARELFGLKIDSNQRVTEGKREMHTCTAGKTTPEPYHLMCCTAEKFGFLDIYGVLPSLFFVMRCISADEDDGCRGINGVEADAQTNNVACME
jgi:hypothetical protein